MVQKVKDTVGSDQLGCDVLNVVRQEHGHHLPYHVHPRRQRDTGSDLGYIGRCSRVKDGVRDFR